MNIRLRIKILIVSFVLAYATVLLLYYYNIVQVEFTIGLIIGLSTIYFAARNYYLEYDRMFKELFIEFNLRYNQYNDVLERIENETVLNLEEQKILNDYFNLCAEEYMWFRRGRIPEYIYSNWLNGTLVHLGKHSIREYFKKELKANTGSYYEWDNYVRSFLKNS